MPADVLIVNLAVLGAVLWADPGTKEITWRRVLRPLALGALGSLPADDDPERSDHQEAH